MLSEKDRGTDTGNMHKKIGEDQLCGFQDMQAHKQTDILITIFHTPPGGTVVIDRLCLGYSYLISWSILGMGIPNVTISNINFHPNLTNVSITKIAKKQSYERRSKIIQTGLRKSIQL